MTPRSIIGMFGLIALIASIYVLVTAPSPLLDVSADYNGFQIASLIAFGLFLLASFANKVGMALDFLEFEWSERRLFALASLIMAWLCFLLAMVGISQSTASASNPAISLDSQSMAIAIFLITTIVYDFGDIYTA